MSSDRVEFLMEKILDEQENAARMREQVEKLKSELQQAKQQQRAGSGASSSAATARGTSPPTTAPVVLATARRSTQRPASASAVHARLRQQQHAEGGGGPVVADPRSYRGSSSAPVSARSASATSASDAEAAALSRLLTRQSALVHELSDIGAAVAQAFLHRGGGGGQRASHQLTDVGEAVLLSVRGAAMAGGWTAADLAAELAVAASDPPLQLRAHWAKAKSLLVDQRRHDEGEAATDGELLRCLRIAILAHDQVPRAQRPQVAGPFLLDLTQQMRLLWDRLREAGVVRTPVDTAVGANFCPPPPAASRSSSATQQQHYQHYQQQNHHHADRVHLPATKMYESDPPPQQQPERTRSASAGSTGSATGGGGGRRRFPSIDNPTAYLQQHLQQPPMHFGRPHSATSSSAGPSSRTNSPHAPPVARSAHSIPVPERYAAASDPQTTYQHDYVGFTEEEYAQARRNSELALHRAVQHAEREQHQRREEQQRAQQHFHGVDGPPPPPAPPMMMRSAYHHAEFADDRDYATSGYYDGDAGNHYYDYRNGEQQFAQTQRPRHRTMNPAASRRIASRHEEEDDEEYDLPPPPRQQHRVVDDAMTQTSPVAADGRRRAAGATTAGGGAAATAPAAAAASPDVSGISSLSPHATPQRSASKQPRLHKFHKELSVSPVSYIGLAQMPDVMMALDDEDIGDRAADEDLYDPARPALSPRSPRQSSRSASAATQPQQQSPRREENNDQDEITRRVQFSP